MVHIKKTAVFILAAAVIFSFTAAFASEAKTDDEIFTKRLSNLYGAPISLDIAKKVASAAISEAKRNGWTVAVAVVDPGGNLIYYERMDGTHNAGASIAIDKAHAAVAFKRSTKLLEDRVVAGRLQYLRLPYAMPIEGGVPLIIDDLIVGAVAVSGARSEQDGVCAKAGVLALQDALDSPKK